MNKLLLRTFWIRTLFATGVTAGCSGQTSLPPNPTVVSTTPNNRAMNVPLAQVISVTFDEAMNHATITISAFTLPAPGANCKNTWAPIVPGLAAWERWAPCHAAALAALTSSSARWSRNSSRNAS